MQKVKYSIIFLLLFFVVAGCAKPPKDPVVNGDCTLTGSVVIEGVDATHSPIGDLEMEVFLAEFSAPDEMVSDNDKNKMLVLINGDKQLDSDGSGNYSYTLTKIPALLDNTAEGNNQDYFISVAADNYTGKQIRLTDSLSAGTTANLNTIYLIRQRNIAMVVYSHNKEFANPTDAVTFNNGSGATNETKYKARTLSMSVGNYNDYSSTYNFADNGSYNIINYDFKILEPSQAEWSDPAITAPIFFDGYEQPDGIHSVRFYEIGSIAELDNLDPNPPIDTTRFTSNHIQLENGKYYAVQIPRLKNGVYVYNYAVIFITDLVMTDY